MQIDFRQSNLWALILSDFGAANTRKRLKDYDVTVHYSKVTHHDLFDFIKRPTELMAGIKVQDMLPIGKASVIVEK